MQLPPLPLLSFGPAVLSPLVLLTAGLLPAQDAGEPIVIGAQHTLRSERLDEERRVLVYTPDSYAGGDARYPVLYLLDGAGHFHHTTGIVQFLADNDRIPEMIVVGVCNTDRTRDLTPSKPAEVEPEFATAGGAATFLQFLTDELTPWLDGGYRTRPVRVLVGHSFGGLFAVYALQQRPDFFDGLIAISPSMQWDDQRLVAETEQWLTGEPEVDAALYLTAGNEGIGLLGGTHKVAGLLSEHAPPSLRWQFEHLPAESHGSVPHRSTYDGLEFVFDGWSLRDPLAVYDVGGLDAVRKHHAGLRARLGYPTELDRAAWFPLIAAMIGKGRLDEACELAAEAGPAMPGQFWDFLASQFEERGDEDGATKCYRRCLDAHPFHMHAREQLTARGVEPPPLPAEAEVAEELLRTYAGRYVLVKYKAPVEITCEDGALYGTQPSGERGRLHARSATEFVGGAAVFVFMREADGSTGLVLRVGGRELRCERTDGGDGDKD